MILLNAKREVLKALRAGFDMLSIILLYGVDCFQIEYPEAFAVSVLGFTRASAENVPVYCRHVRLKEFLVNCSFLSERLVNKRQNLILDNLLGVEILDW